jgi:hypothetical protein
MAPRYQLVLGLTAIAALVALLWPAMPQPAAYHDFADHRTLLGIANFLDVASNAGFLLAGLYGLAVTLHHRTVFGQRAERLPWAVFFVGVLATAAGSAWYHHAPDNASLVWDRLPMTVAFMGLIAAQLVDRISVRAGLLLLVPLLAVGAGSVLYWQATEVAGAGNVIPYGVLQGYSVVMLLVLALLFPSRYTRGADLYWVFAAYVAAKIFEALDRPLFALGGVLSGHTLKHLAAAIAGVVVARMLWRRRLDPDSRCNMRTRMTAEHR